jgi:Icc protein
MSGRINRRGVLECMAWAGTGVLWTVAGGVPRSFPIESAAAAEASGQGLGFVQISDSHIGFAKEANPDVVGTLEAAIARIATLPTAPPFLIHTGDVSHLSKPEELATASDVIGSLGVPVHYVPGEHDMLVDNGRTFVERFGTRGQGAGWYSFDQAGVHFIGLVNVVDLRPGGLGRLGEEQLAWLEQDLAGRSAETPIVVFAHIPLWTVYAEWGWGTEDAARALGHLRRFGSVTVLNGHIHQVMQKVEGSVTFHTAMSTAFPQPRPGTAASPGPLKVPAAELRHLLGTTDVTLAVKPGALAITDHPLEAA